jgi:hypothetical protein
MCRDLLPVKFQEESGATAIPARTIPLRRVD